MKKLLAAFALALLFTHTNALAQAPDAASANGGDTAWILTSSAFVLLMTLPGLSLFYGGLLRAKNFLSVMVQIGAIASIGSLTWLLIGYSMAFGDVSGGIVGGIERAMFAGLDPIRDATTIPENTFALFQMMFAAITPALMVGAWVDRARFGWVIGFCVLWGLVVYAPVAHWVWGGGWLYNLFNTKDFAGGIVVHTTAGVSALIAAKMVGKRQGFPKTLMLPHSPALTMAGAGLLWMGWFGFNGGSALAANAGAASAIINTHIAACTAALVWLLIERLSVGKPTSVGFATGAVAGLATVTPAAGFIAPASAILFGIAATAICYPMIQVVKRRMKIDDSLDVFAVHGVGGIIGSILLAVFISASLGGTGYDEGHTMGSQLLGQIVGVGAVALWSAIASYALALGLSKILPMRVAQEAEYEGLDITSHGERAWELD